ncbi:hypothetical protein J6590_092744 [Homalodisca vitripennis]|nr:hypothetical protein J6590_092744 [Homalodisca vitripennis]
MDNAPYHNKQDGPAPTTSSRKAEIIEWLSERNIVHSSTMFKLELYNLIQAYKPTYKKKSSEKNVTFNINTVEQLVKETCDSITQEDWRKRCDHTKSVEQSYMELERQFDEMTERIVVRLGEDSDSDEWDEESGNDEDREPIVDNSDSGDDDLTGIVPFECY